jgi:hypothetical protein
MKSIGKFFLGDCLDLTYIDLSLLQNITSIGDNFLANCSRLTSIYHAPYQKTIILQKNPDLAALLKEKRDPYWNYTEESKYNEDYAEFCENMKPHSLIVLQKILDKFKIPYSKAAPREKLCRILYLENKKHNKKYTEEEIKRMCNGETIDPISLNEFIKMPKNEIIRLPKNDHSIVDKCYERSTLEKLCFKDTVRGTRKCLDPINRTQDLFVSHPTEMNNLMLYNEDKDKYFKEDEDEDEEEYDVVVDSMIPH